MCISFGRTSSVSAKSIIASGTLQKIQTYKYLQSDWKLGFISLPAEKEERIRRKQAFGKSKRLQSRSWPAHAIGQSHFDSEWMAENAHVANTHRETRQKNANTGEYQSVSLLCSIGGARELLWVKVVLCPSCNQAFKLLDKSKEIAKASLRTFTCLEQNLASWRRCLFPSPSGSRRASSWRWTFSCKNWDRICRHI